MTVSIENVGARVPMGWPELLQVQSSDLITTSRVESVVTLRYVVSKTKL